MSKILVIIIRLAYISPEYVASNGLDKAYQQSDMAGNAQLCYSLNVKAHLDAA